MNNYVSKYVHPTYNYGTAYILPHAQVMDGINWFNDNRTDVALQCVSRSVVSLCKYFTQFNISDMLSVISDRIFWKIK